MKVPIAPTQTPTRVIFLRQREGSKAERPSLTLSSPSLSPACSFPDTKCVSSDRTNCLSAGVLTKITIRTRICRLCVETIVWALMTSRPLAEAAIVCMLVACGKSVSTVAQTMERTYIVGAQPPCDSRPVKHLPNVGTKKSELDAIPVRQRVHARCKPEVDRRKIRTETPGLQTNAFLFREPLARRCALVPSFIESRTSICILIYGFCDQRFHLPFLYSLVEPYYFIFYTIGTVVC